MCLELDFGLVVFFFFYQEVEFVVYSVYLGNLFVSFPTKPLAFAYLCKCPF